MKLSKNVFVLICALVPLTSVAMKYEEEINTDYILRADLMPGSLLMLDGGDSGHSHINESSDRKREKLSSNGSWYDAYSTMEFHRKMFNEYLCRNFLADEILSQMRQPLISRRVGRPFKKVADRDKHPNNRKSRADVEDVKENLLSDPGSSNYRDWLTKTATLEDVYRHYDMSVSRNGEETEEEEYDGGEFTGYAMPGPAPAVAAGYGPHPPAAGVGQYANYGPPPPPPYHGGGSGPHGDMEKLGGYDYTPHHVHFHGSDSDKSSNHGLALNDMFDVALTALAFLSFGMFILQVIMCITMNKPTVPMMQMTETEIEPDSVDDIRFKRDTHEARSAINELSRRILNSIEAGVAAQQDEGACLRWTLCDNNKYSRSLEDSQKFWIPVWGLGMTWLSSRLIRGPPSTSAMLESLRACALGLARVDCSSVYSDCDLRHLLVNRKSHRRKRTATSAGVKKGDTLY